VVEQLERDRRQHDRRRYRCLGHAVVTHEDRERTKGLRRAQELPAQQGLDLAMALLGPSGDIGAQALQLLIDPEATREPLRRERATEARHAVSSRASGSPSSVTRRTARS